MAMASAFSSMVNGLLCSVLVPNMYPKVNVNVSLRNIYQGFTGLSRLNIGYAVNGGDREGFTCPVIIGKCFTYLIICHTFCPHTFNCRDNFPLYIIRFEMYPIG